MEPEWVVYRHKPTGKLYDVWRHDGVLRGWAHDRPTYSGLPEWSVPVGHPWMAEFEATDLPVTAGF